MTTDELELLSCDKLGEDIIAGIATRDVWKNIGYEHEHWVFLVKVITGLDPTQRYKPTKGTAFVKIRPNEQDPAPSNENGKEWDWYLLTCPHQVPCPILTDLSK